jgi:hypothetical protein
VGDSETRISAHKRANNRRTTTDIQQMTETDTIKIRESDKEYLDELMEGDEITKYGSLSYADVIQYMADLHREGNLDETGGDSAGGSNVTRTVKGGENSAETEENEGLSAAEKADKFRQ